MKSKHLFQKLMMAGLITAGLAGCGDVDPTRVTGVTLSANTHTMEKEDSFTLTATVEPSTAINTLVTYSSTDPTILSVDEKTGVVTALKDGNAAIIVTTNDGKKTDRCDFVIKTSEYIITSDISPKASYTAYKNNKKDNLGDAELFLVPNLEYNVGSNNAINLMPKYDVWSEEADDFVVNSKWKYDHEIKVDIKGLDGTYSTADSSYYTVESARSCDIKFNSNAIGKVFKVSITPGNLSAEYKAQHANTQTAVYEDLKVVDGYNIYTADELSYIDTREETFEGEANPWVPFKEDKGIDLKFHPTTLVLHNNMQITKANMPADYFFSGLEGNFAKYNGTLKDWAEVYRHVTGNNVNIYGNYFKLDFSSLPVVEYKDGAAVSDNFVSHATLITVDNGTANFNNLNLLGNASNSKEKEDGSQDTSGRGGFIFCKGRKLADSVIANNNIFRSWFITYMGENSSNVNGYVDYVLNDCKGRDNYNSFLYNWGGKMTCNRCSFKSCGGPIVIQDHVGVDGDDYGSTDGTVIKGRPGSCAFIDCELVNYVAGTEAWFIQFGATAVVAQIKALADSLITKGVTYLVAKNPMDPTKYVPCASNAAVSQMTGGAIPYITPNFFNFIAINKSGTAEGITNLPVHGEISIINTTSKTNQKFNYSRPNLDAAKEIQDLIDLAIKYGLYTSENAALFAALNELAASSGASSLVDKAVCQGLRTLNGQGAPVIQCGNNFGTIIDQTTGTIMDVKSMATSPAEVAADFASYVSPEDGTIKRQDSCAVYFNGMMLVFGLTGFQL